MRTAIDELPDLMTPDELARATGGNAAVIRRNLAAGVIPGDKVGRKWFIAKANVIGRITNGK